MELGVDNTAARDIRALQPGAAPPGSGTRPCTRPCSNCTLSGATSLWIRECVENLKLTVPYVNTVDNLADFFTKPLVSKTFFRMRDRIMFMIIGIMYRPTHESRHVT